MRRKILAQLTLSLLLVLLLSSNICYPDDEEAQQLQALVQKIAPSIVTIQVVLKMEWTFGGQTQTSEQKIYLRGVLVSPDGLLLVNNLSFSAARLKEMMEGEEEGGGEEPGYKMDIIPTAFKVVFEREEKEYDAFLVATESKLDLAFLKVKELGDRKLTPVSFSQPVEAAIGQKVVSIGRLSKGFDYAPYFVTGRICGEITKPRKAWMISGDINNEVGLPVFALSGEPIGVLTTLSSGIKERGMRFGFPMMGRWGPGMEAYGMFLIHGSAIKALIEQASKRAAEIAAGGK